MILENPYIEIARILFFNGGEMKRKLSARNILKQLTDHLRELGFKVTERETTPGGIQNRRCFETHTKDIQGCKTRCIQRNLGSGWIRCIMEARRDERRKLGIFNYNE
jgi:hypothetical protein